MYQHDANNFIMILSHKWPLHISDIYMSIFRSSGVVCIKLVHLPYLYMMHGHTYIKV